MYIEKVRIPKILFGLFIFQFLLISILNEWESFTEYLFVAIFCTLVAFVVFLSSFSIKIDQSKINYSFLFINKKIKWEDVEYIEIKDDIRNDFPFGLGVYYSRKFGWGYVFGSETGLYVKLKNNKQVVLNIVNKDDLIAFINLNKIEVIVR